MRVNNINEHLIVTYAFAAGAMKFQVLQRHRKNTDTPRAYPEIQNFFRDRP